MTSSGSEDTNDTIYRGDGTALSVTSSGAGEPVVLVHGTSGSSEGWAFIVPQLSTDFRVITYDRRGRGKSTDGPDYSFAAEVDDLLAVLEWVGLPAHLFAHSFGARTAMHGLQKLRAHISTLVLYEPPLALETTPAETFEAIEEATRAGDWEEVLAWFYPLASITAEEIAMMRSLPPVWDACLDGARTVAREVRVLREAPVDVRALEQVGVPTLVLVGGETSSPVFLDGLDDVADALGAPVEAIEGQRHLATVGAPDAVAATIRRFILRSRP